MEGGILMILVTGADGYLGWPVMLRLAKTFPQERIVGVDNGKRRMWVREVGSVSAIPIASMVDRQEVAHDRGFVNITLIEGDLADVEFVRELLGVFKPRVIVHLGAQPSVSYAEINAVKARYTMENNCSMLCNLLWTLKELNLLGTHFIETTSTGVYGSLADTVSKTNREVLADSWMESSKVNNINLLYLAQKQWGLPVTDLRTAIIYGVGTRETREAHLLATRFDFDFYFGTVVNRFVAQALALFPLTVYGRGLQRRPVISLEDAVESVVRAVKVPSSNSFNIYNQMTGAIRIADLAQLVQKASDKLGLKAEVVHVSNPRIEKEDNEIEIDNRGFVKLLHKSPAVLQEAIEEMLFAMAPYDDTLKAHSDRFMER